MSGKKVWFITGAGRGMGVDFATAVLAAGDAVVATGRNPDAVAKALGEEDDLLVVKLDVTNGAEAAAAVRAAVERFGRIDVLVNNAANFYAGYFEELTPEQIERQLATSLIGPMNVTRAVLPVMRKQRSGHVISISSGAGLMGFEFNSVYCSGKFGLEGWTEALQPEVAPFGIHTTIVNPGSFAPSFLLRSRRPTPRRRSRTTPSATPTDGHGMRPRTASRPATRPSSPRRSSRSQDRSRRRAASSPAPMPSPSPSRKCRSCRSRSTPIATYRPRSHETRSTMLRTGEYLAVEVPKCTVNSTTLGQNPER